MRKTIISVIVLALLMAAATLMAATVDVYKAQDGRWKMRTSTDTEGREFDLQEDVGLRVTTKDSKASVLRLTADVGTGSAVTLDWWEPKTHDPLYVLEIGMLHKGELARDKDGNARIDVIIIGSRAGVGEGVPRSVRCIRGYAHYVGREGEYGRYLIIAIPTSREDVLALFGMEAFYLPLVDIRSNINPDLYADRIEKLRIIRAMTCEKGGVLKVDGAEAYRSRKGQEK